MTAGQLYVPVAQRMLLQAKVICHVSHHDDVSDMTPLSDWHEPKIGLQMVKSGFDRMAAKKAGGTQ